MITTILMLIQLLLSLIAIYIVYMVYRYNKENKGWLFLGVGFSFIFILRILIEIKNTGNFASFFQYWKIIEPIIRILISAFQIIGLWSLLKSFEDFKALGSSVKNKIKRNK